MDELDYRWFHLSATKANSEKFDIWILSENYPPNTLEEAKIVTAQYIFHPNKSDPIKYQDQSTGKAALPLHGAWKYLFPRFMENNDLFSQGAKYLGHNYQLESLEDSSLKSDQEFDDFIHSPDAKVVNLRSDLLIGPPHNTRQKDETRRYDGSDYELIRLTPNDYNEMIDAGINCLRVDSEQVEWIKNCHVFYWGIGGNDVSYPECLYQSNYLGLTIFMDEPAVCTRDQVIRPRLESDPDFRKSITPQIVFEEFQSYFLVSKYENAPISLLKSLSTRSDVDLGEMQFLQENIYVWETMISSAAYELLEGDTRSPYAIVFEPPGRIGTMRSLPEINMTYGCQIPVDNPKNLSSIIYGFLRGAARVTNKNWGMSIYGQFHRADAFWFQTHAYDLGSIHFHYWDSHELACVPYSEYLALSRNLSQHAKSHPKRDLKKLRSASEIVILLPVGYNLGHVDLGRGNLWGLGELNLERRNHQGIKYRAVMGNFFTEIERLIRLGIAFDLIWDLDELDLSSYREVIRIREDGKVEVIENGKKILHNNARKPVRPSGSSPKITVDVSINQDKIIAIANVSEGATSIYYTRGANDHGIYTNDLVCWELFGPSEEDYLFLNRMNKLERYFDEVKLKQICKINFEIKQSGNYRLRAATVDLAGRTAVVWKDITVKI